MKLRSKYFSLPDTIRSISKEIRVGNNSSEPNPAITNPVNTPDRLPSKAEAAHIRDILGIPKRVELSEERREELRERGRNNPLFAKSAANPAAPTRLGIPAPELSREP
jgi:hypothetical protein